LGEYNENYIENVDEMHFVMNTDNGKTLGFRGDQVVKYVDVVSGGGNNDNGCMYHWRHMGGHHGPHDQLHKPNETLSYMWGGRQYPWSLLSDWTKMLDGHGIIFAIFC
jgi:hypothetical protein